jgi:hypothetical protein
MTVPATLNPWEQEGIPLDQQFRSWEQIVRPPYDKREVDAYTRARVILMNGIEQEAWTYSHNFARMTDNREVQALLARTRRVEQQQQTTINWLNPADQTILETTIGYEQVAVDLTAYLARHEPDEYMREAMHFGLLEDFDHLYRYSELLDYLEGTDPESITQGRTEILPGRPTADHHNDPEARLLRHYEKNRAQPSSKLHIWTILAAEQQTRQYYASHGFLYDDKLARDLYAEIGAVEEEHVTFYESLIDPSETLLERQVLHELVEVYNYFHCHQQEPDERIRRIWEDFLLMELTHLQLWGDMLQRYEGRDPQELFGGELRVDFAFTENKEYLRTLTQQQHGLRLHQGQFVWKDDLPEDWPSYSFQRVANADGIPSERILDRRLDGGDGRVGDSLLVRARDLAVELRDGLTTPTGL